MKYQQYDQSLVNRAPRRFTDRDNQVTMVKCVFLFVAAVVCITNAKVITSTIPTVTLNDGNKMPVFGLGTWLNGGSNENVQEAVEAALAAGYRHIDTAAIYDTEKQVGAGLKTKVDDGTIKREDIFITTKLWNDKHEEEEVVPALRQSLENLGLEFVDLYLIHWPVSLNEKEEVDDTDFIGTWKGMEEAKRLGLTKSIGVSNFNITQLKRLLNSTKTVPAMNQIEVNPNFTQKKLIAFCKEHGIEITAYTPLGSMPEPRAKDKDAPAPKLDDPVLSQIGSKYGKSTVQVVLRYALDRGLVTIPKSVTPSRIQQNIDIFDFKLTPEEVATIDGFNIDRRVVLPVKWSASPFYPFETQPE